MNAQTEEEAMACDKSKSLEELAAMARECMENSMPDMSEGSDDGDGMEGEDGDGMTRIRGPEDDGVLVLLGRDQRQPCLASTTVGEVLTGLHVEDVAIEVEASVAGDVAHLGTGRDFKQPGHIRGPHVLDIDLKALGDPGTHVLVGRCCTAGSSHCTEQQGQRKQRFWPDHTPSVTEQDGQPRG